MLTLRRLLSPVLFLFLLTSAIFAAAPPALSVQDSGGRTASIDATGVVVFGGACTPASCTTQIVNVSVGQIVWGGTIGTFSITAAVGLTKPAIVPTPSLDLNLQRLTTTADGTITFRWSDTDFNYSGITGGHLAVGGLLRGNGSSTYQAYFDNTNTLFGTGVPVATVGPLGVGPFSGSAMGAGPTAAPFSMTQVATVTLTANSIFGVDYQFSALPTPLRLNCAPAAGEVGAFYSSNLMPIGGIPPYTYSIISGSLPPGLSLNPSTGAITGIPTQAGTASFTAQVVDSSQNFGQDTATTACNIVVTTPPPLSVFCPMSTGQVNVPYTSGLAASGGLPPYTFSIAAGSLPTGLSLNPSTGAITGTPTAAGTFAFTAQVVDSRGNLAGTATSSCNITIAPPPLTATCAAATTGQVNVPYSSSIVPSGGTPPYTFALASGSLPAGLFLNASTGAITGTPTTAGPSSFTVLVTDSTSGTALTFTTPNCGITIAPPPLTATCVAATTGQVNVPYSSNIVPSGGTPPYTFALASGSLPAGLSLNASTGAITGTPTTAGPSSFTVLVTDSTSGTALTFTTPNCGITIAPPPLTATCVAATTGQVNVPYSSNIVPSGGTPPYTFALASGSLPAGLSLNASTGAITGTPTTAGPSSFTVKVTDSTSGTALTFTTPNCGITIAPPPLTATCVAATTGQVNVPYSSSIVPSGGTPPYTFALASGSLPAGLSLNASTGAITGTPTTAGPSSFTVKVTDSTSGTALTFTTPNCGITIAPPPSATCISITAVNGTPITPVTMVGTGGNGGPYTFSATGLPTGLTMSTTGTISGTPTVTGTFNYTVTVKDKDGNAGTVNCSVVVNPRPSANCITINAIQNVAITPVTMVGSGGNGGPYTFSATGLPTGLTMSTTGTISGTPTVTGTFNYTVTVKDKDGNAGTVNCSVVVNPRPSANCITINAIQNVAITPVTMVGSGGNGGPYTFSATGLPTGLTMSTTGTISGTPTVSGTFNYTVTVKDKDGNAGSVNCSVVVNPQVVCVPTTFGLTGSTSTTGTAGNIRTFTAGNGIQVKASAWSRDKSNGAWATAYLGSYSSGLGVTDSSENGSDPTHRVDNVGSRVNYVLFEFSAPVIVNRAFLDAVGVDSDISVWIGTKVNPFTNHIALSDAQLTSLAQFEENLTTSDSSRWADINGSNLSGNILVIAALASDTSAEDEFKISHLETACITTPGKPTASCISITAVQNVAIAPVTMSATGGVGGPYTFSATGLPAGLTMSTSGTISGTPTVSGTFSYTVTIKDKSGNIGTVNCSLTVNPGAVCVPSTLYLTGNTATSGTAGNVRTFTASSGVQVKASGWSRQKSNGAWTTAYLGSYSSGLGVTDSSEDGSDPTHRVDNVGTRVNYVLFEFSTSVVVNRAFLDAVGADSDVSVWIGTKTSPFTNHLTLSDSLLTSLGTFEENQTSSGDSRWADFNAAGVQGNVLVIAALASDTSAEDEFKISKIETVCLTLGSYKTFTQGGWGAAPSGTNAGNLLSTKFSNVYPGGSVVVGNTYKLTFTSASAIANFLPQYGTAGKLTANATNPTTSAAGVLAGQVLALQLNVDFSNKGILPAGFANLKIASGPGAGLTVAQALSTAEAILGGSSLPSGFSYADVVEILDAINKSFDNGTVNTGYVK